MRARWILMLLAVSVFACESERAAAPADSGTSAYFSRQQVGAHGARGAAPSELEAVTVTGASKLPPLTLPDMTATMVLRTATASIEVDSLETAVAQVKELAARAGGYVANTGIETGKHQLRRAVIEVKVPAARFDEIMSGLTPIGTLESVEVSAQDVGEEYVDVTARMENARRLERRLIELLATRTGKLKDVLDVEEALARVREEIERYEGRIRYLRAHTATSTISVTVHEPVPVVGGAGRSVMGEAFRQAWRNFVALTAVAVQSLGVIIPLGAVALLVWFGARRWRRVFSQRTA